MRKLEISSKMLGGREGFQKQRCGQNLVPLRRKREGLKTVGSRTKF